MNKTALCAIAAAAALAFASEAAALTLTNRDVGEVHLQIQDAGSGSSQTVTIGPEETLDGICEAGCTVALEDGSTQDFEGDEVLEIQDGSFVVVE